MDPLLEKTFDLRLQLPNHALFVGASMSGKTRLVLHLLDRLETLHPMPQTILFYYDQYQEQYGHLKQRLARQGIKISLLEGSSFTLGAVEKKEHQTLVIIDDASEETASSSAIAKVTTNGRHKNLSLWLIWHSLYSKHAASRLITQNVGYMFLLPSVRMTSQIHTLDTQLRMKGALVSAYKQACDNSSPSGREETPHKYLLVDLSAQTPSELRLRTNVTEPIQVAFLS